ncbi:DUF6058 family natural product biosynthesis protein [Janthinobacterium sp. SUN211]|uniref:DUF6058 family natural product biosynthesis protein n=1 Tax=Janthinobacterium sp. SUN211 TaxID=3014786 RepID=UPI0027127D5D|nr:DUF6058 family natural product biosynthesis protein [Janthinobacterium sp. SUN211]MDO8047267.1 DUF6058 family natural product biosynthesis protein [Janthinobacterium sp. SUN211]
MTELDHYLAHHYLDETQLAAAAAMTMEEIDALIQARLVPAPAYVVDASGNLCSFVFGVMAAPGSRAGRYFPPSQLAWIAVALHALAEGPETAPARLQAQFASRYGAALATLNLTTWRLRDSFDDRGAPIAEGLRARTDSAWTYFLNGTFSLCVANPMSEAHIAWKEVLQEKLAQQSGNGSKTLFSQAQALFSQAQAQQMHALIDAYAAAAMPFSPIEYALSSRKRLVEDLRANLRVSDAQETPA